MGVWGSPSRSCSSYEVANVLNPNPNPNNWKLISFKEVNDFLILQLEYPDCTNYEGKKILVFHNTTLVELVNQKSIDPHFSNNKTFKSPIARFAPTTEGLKMALSFVQNYKGPDNVQSNK